MADWLGAFASGVDGYRRGQQRDKDQAREDKINSQVDYVRDREFSRQQQADKIADSPLDMVSPAPQQTGGMGATGGTGGTEPTQAIGLDMATTPGSAPQPAAPQTRAEDPYLAEQSKVLRGIEMKRKAALEHGRSDLWSQYGQQANNVRNTMIASATQRGFQQFQLNRDLNALLPAANLVHDGMEFSGVQKNPDGSVIVSTSQFGKPGKPLTYKTEAEAVQALKDYTDPVSASARAKRTDDFIWKSKETVMEENAKAEAKARGKNMENQVLSASEILTTPDGKVIASAPHKPLSAGGKGGGGAAIAGGVEGWKFNMWQQSNPGGTYEQYREFMSGPKADVRGRMIMNAMKAKDALGIRPLYPTQEAAAAAVDQALRASPDEAPPQPAKPTQPAAPQAKAAPKAALDYLKANPSQASAFKAKYGYLP